MASNRLSWMGALAAAMALPYAASIVSAPEGYPMISQPNNVSVRRWHKPTGIAASRRAAKRRRIAARSNPRGNRNG